MSAFRKFVFLAAALMIIGSVVFGGWSQAIAAAERPTSITQKVVGGQPFDIHLGDGGMSSPASAYNATLKLARVVPYYRIVGDKRFINRWIEISVVNDSAANARTVSGLVYVYFNLDRQTRRLWDAGELKIYFRDTEKEKWVECAINKLLPSKSDPYGRIACAAARFGRYGLATTGRLPQ
jgi:hypothetical protein